MLSLSRRGRQRGGSSATTKRAHGGKKARKALSARSPGLGDATGLIDLDSSWMSEAALEDPEIADFVLRARDIWVHWYELFNASPEDFFAQGCGW